MLYNLSTFRKLRSCVQRIRPSFSNPSSLSNRPNCIVFAKFFSTPSDYSDKVNVPHVSAQQEAKKIVRIALFGNTIITLAKCSVWITTGSSAMLAETVHSLVDLGNQSLLLIGLTNAENSPDKYHQCNSFLAYSLCLNYS